MEDNEEADEALVDLVALGTDMAGSAGGAAVRLFAGGPGGALVGSVAGVGVTHALRAVATDIKRRWLSHRETTRVGGVLAASVAEFARRIAAGETLRADGFFDQGVDDRSSAEEVIEHALLVAKDEAEERKIRFIGRMTAGVCFDPSISRAQANNLVRTAEGLSYQQLIMLHLFSSETPRPGFRDESYRAAQSFSLELIHVLDEVHQLDSRGLVTNGAEFALGITDIVPAKVKTQGVGAQLVTLMGLDAVPDDAETLNRLTQILAAAHPPESPPP